MKTNNLLWYSLMFLLLIASSCSKKDDDSPPPSVQELLTSGEWYLEVFGSSTLSDCNKKTAYYFAINGALNRKSYADVWGVCTLVEEDNGSWEILSNGNLEMTFGGGPTAWDIKSITSQKISLFGSFSGTGYTMEFDKTPE